ncbi:hypothetical protein ACU8M0_02630 [Rhizobium leguminosarum]|jgi:hypothetical protein
MLPLIMVVRAMIERLKVWASMLPIVRNEVTALSRRVDLLTQQADTLSAQLTYWETQAAAWQAVLVNEQLKIRSVLDEMDIVLRGIAASPADSRPKAGEINGGNSEAIVALAEEVKKLRADLLDGTGLRATSAHNEQ